MAGSPSRAASNGSAPALGHAMPPRKRPPCRNLGHRPASLRLPRRERHLLVRVLPAPPCRLTSLLQAEPSRISRADRSKTPGGTSEPRSRRRSTSTIDWRRSVHRSRSRPKAGLRIVLGPSARPFLVTAGVRQDPGRRRIPPADDAARPERQRELQGSWPRCRRRGPGRRRARFPRPGAGFRSMRRRVRSSGTGCPPRTTRGPGPLGGDLRSSASVMRLLRPASGASRSRSAAARPYRASSSVTAGCPKRSSAERAALTKGAAVRWARTSSYRFVSPAPLWPATTQRTGLHPLSRRLAPCVLRPAPPACARRSRRGGP